MVAFLHCSMRQIVSRISGATNNWHECVGGENQLDMGTTLKMNFF